MTKTTERIKTINKKYSNPNTLSKLSVTGIYIKSEKHADNILFEVEGKIISLQRDIVNKLAHDLLTLTDIK